MQPSSRLCFGPSFYRPSLLLGLCCCRHWLSGSGGSDFSDDADDKTTKRH
ncbi:hypothetical protein PspLS_03392 [Pyricularia sp. CBS 133598]|nr:hypothetical protein PspLS_03392 [Pyricularia sp. CBS 133598]